MSTSPLLAIITRIDDDHRQLELDESRPDCFDDRADTSIPVFVA
jgi:hypothetical protein